MIGDSDRAEREERKEGVKTSAFVLTEKKEGRKRLFFFPSSFKENFWMKKREKNRG